MGDKTRFLIFDLTIRYFYSNFIHFAKDQYCYINICALKKILLKYTAILLQSNV